jgi:hypothetical protein
MSKDSILKWVRAGAFDKPYSKDKPLLAWSRWRVEISWKLEDLLFKKVDQFKFVEVLEASYPKLVEFIRACPNTKSLDPDDVIQEFLNHFMMPTPGDPERKFKRYGRKGFTQGYQIFFIKSFCNHLTERYAQDGSRVRREHKIKDNTEWVGNALPDNNVSFSPKKKNDEKSKDIHEVTI